MKRITAAFRKRSVEHDHRFSVLASMLLGAFPAVFALPGAALAFGVWMVASSLVWLWGLWDEGRALVPREHRAGLRRR